MHVFNYFDKNKSLKSVTKCSIKKSNLKKKIFFNKNVSSIEMKIKENYKIDSKSKMELNSIEIDSTSSIYFNNLKMENRIKFKPCFRLNQSNTSRLFISLFSLFSLNNFISSFSSYLLKTSSNFLVLNCKKNHQFFKLSFLNILLFCLIQFSTLNKKVFAASTAFDHHLNNQSDNPNSIVYQDASYNTISDVHIECNSNNIIIILNTQNEQFSGLVYPKGLSKNSSCMVEYNHKDSANITYLLPLRSCNTMSTDVDNGVEYFNTIVVQPHRRLVTNQGKGYHVRCRYQTKDKSITNTLNVTTINNIPIIASAPIPGCSMKIFAEDTNTEIFVAENVKIGDKLKIEIKIEDQPVYGMKVTNCIVRDGLNWAEQPLLNDEGCPIDEDILGQFQYSRNLTKASVSFQAHKFPYTSSVYYQCNVRLCLKLAGGCFDAPPECDQNRHNSRKRRDIENRLNDEKFVAALRSDEIKELSVEVYSGLHVNEADSEDEGDLLPPKKIISEQEFCISMRKFAIGVTIASMLLMTAVVLLVACILQRRRRRKHISTTCSSIYSGPYSNRGFSRD